MSLISKRYVLLFSFDLISHFSKLYLNENSYLFNAGGGSLYSVEVQSFVCMYFKQFTQLFFFIIFVNKIIDSFTSGLFKN